MRAQQRKLFWLVIGVTAFILTGCGGGGGGGGGETPTDSRTLTTNYFPNSQGSLINYEGRTSTAGTLTDRFFNALTVVGPGTYKGKAVTVLSESRITSYNVCYTKLLRSPFLTPGEFHPPHI